MSNSNSNDVNSNTNPNRQAPAPRLPRGDRRRGQFRGPAPTPVPPAPKKPEIVTVLEATPPSAVQIAVDAAREESRPEAVVAIATSLSVKPAERDGCRVCAVETCTRLAGTEPHCAVAVRDGVPYPICRPHCRVGAAAFLALREKGIRIFDSQEQYSRARNEEERLAAIRARRELAEAAAKAAKAKKERVLTPQEIANAIRARAPVGPAAKKPSAPPAATPGSERALARDKIASLLAKQLETTREKLYSALQRSAEMPASEWEAIQAAVAKRLETNGNEEDRRPLLDALALLEAHRQSVQERMTAAR